MALGKRGRDAGAIRERIAKVQAEVADDRQAAAEDRRLIASREQLADELAELEARGDIGRDEVDEQLAAAAREANEQERRAAARSRAADKRELEIADLERQLAHAQHDDALRAAAAAARKLTEAETPVAAAIEQLLSVFRRAAAARDAFEDAQAELEERRPDGVDELAERVRDADDWPAGIDELIGFLEKGPRQPEAQSATRAAEQRRGQQQRENEVVTSFVRQFGGVLSPTAEAALRDFRPEMQTKIRAACARAQHETAERRAALELV